MWVNLGFKPARIQLHEIKEKIMRKTEAIIDEVTDMYTTENDISLDHRTNMIRLMNQRLASAVDLQMQMKQAHWNVKGPSFIGLHELFDKAYAEAEGYVDLIAERIVQFGGIAYGTVRSSAASSELTDYPAAIADGLAHVEAVARALATFGSEARSMICEANTLEDAGTADIFTEISRGVDKMLWFVEAHSQSAK
jgi:starvation-inducible DNA-binding protein